MGEMRSVSPLVRLDLNNFDTSEAEDSRYVLTSPRSLESCAKLGVQPVELLIKSLNEFIAERRAMPCEAVTVMHESYEKERRKLLRLCREERERIIMKQAAPVGSNRWGGANKLSALETVLEFDTSSSKSKDGCDADERTGPGPHVEHRGIGRRSDSVSRSTCNADKEQNRLKVDQSISSLSLGDLRHSPATEQQLERLTRDIRKDMSVTVPDRDRKIAALMLVRHQEEQARLKLRQQEEHERQEARRQEEAQRAEIEKKRRKKLRRSMQRWHEEVEGRRRLREREEEELAVLREQEVLLQEDRWRRLMEEQEAQRREKIETAQKEAEVRKHNQVSYREAAERQGAFGEDGEGAGETAGAGEGAESQEEQRDSGEEGEEKAAAGEPEGAAQTPPSQTAGGAAGGGGGGADEEHPGAETAPVLGETRVGRGGAAQGAAGARGVAGGTGTVGSAQIQAAEPPAAPTQTAAGPAEPAAHGEGCYAHLGPDQEQGSESPTEQPAPPAQPPADQSPAAERGGGAERGQRETHKHEGVQEGEAEEAEGADSGGGAQSGLRLLPHEGEGEGADTASHLQPDGPGGSDHRLHGPHQTGIMTHYQASAAHWNHIMTAL